MYDVIIIGGGAAGIEAAKGCVQAGLRTLLIEKESNFLGGVCLNRGCIPTKFYLKHYHSGDWNILRKKKNILVSQIRQDLFNLLREKVDFVWGEAFLVSPYKVRVNKDIFETKYIIIATGSSPREIIFPGGKNIFVAEDILNLSQLEEKNLVIGAGVLGLEVATLLNCFGKYVEIVEKEEQIMPSLLDKDVANRLKMIMERKGIKIHLRFDIDNYNVDDFDMVINCTGRVPFVPEGINLELTERGGIGVDSQLRTSVDNIFACGDVVGEFMLAYAAEYEAEVVIENILGREKEVNYRGIPLCAFSFPQVGAVGLREDDLKKEGLGYKVYKTNFRRFSSAYVYDDLDGFIKIIKSEDDKLLGAQIISNYAAELLNIFSVFIRADIPLNKFKPIFIHPTVGEIVGKLL